MPWTLLGFADPSTQRVAFYSGKGAALEVRYDFVPTMTVQAHVAATVGAVPEPVFPAPLVHAAPKWTHQCYCERYKQAAAVVVAALDAAAGRGNTTPSALPRQPVFCECVAPPPQPVTLATTLKSAVIVASVLTIGLFAGYAGLVRPLMERFVPGLEPSSIKASPGRVQLQVCGRPLWAGSAPEGAEGGGTWGDVERR